MFVWTISDFLGFASAAIAITIMVVMFIYISIKQCFCKHEKCYENRACHAICCNCGKDTGFIENYRKRNKEG